MGKRVGKEYDHAIRTSEAGSRLYNSWRKIRRHPHCEEWIDFPTFYAWAIHSGYSLGDWLRRYDDNEPYGPDNCVWVASNRVETPPKSNVEWEYEWNVTVNRIRKHYGMPPLEGTNYGD